MTEPALRYAVLLASPERREPEALARAFKEIGSEAPAAGRWGILAEGLDEAPARALAAGLTKAALPSLAIPVGLLEDLPEPEPLPRVALALEGLLPLGEEGGGTGQKPLVPWKRLVLVGAAGFRRVETRKVKVVEGPGFLRRALALGLTLATGLPSAWAGRRQEVEKTLESRDMVYFVDLLFREPARRLRVDAQAFDYSCLGSLKVLDAFGNLRSLIAELSRLAPGAGLNHGAEVLLGAKPLRETGYTGLSDLERECRWRLTLEALKPS